MHPDNQYIGNLPIAANTIDKTRAHDKFPFSECNKPHLKISFENLYSLHWISQRFHYTHKQSLARVPLFGLQRNHSRIVIKPDLVDWTWSSISDSCHFAISYWRYIFVEEICSRSVIATTCLVKLCKSLWLVSTGTLNFSLTIIPRARMGYESIAHEAIRWSFRLH